MLTMLYNSTVGMATDMSSSDNN